MYVAHGPIGLLGIKFTYLLTMFYISYFINKIASIFLFLQNNNYILCDLKLPNPFSFI